MDTPAVHPGTADTRITPTSPRLFDIAKPGEDKVLNPKSLEFYGGITADAPVLVVLAAGKGTRFGQEPKCIQMVHGTPLARHSIDAFRRVSASPAVCVVGYRCAEVSAALGSDNVYVRTDDPTGGTAVATAEAFSVADLVEKNPLLVITMGDRIVPSVIFRRLLETHGGPEREADLTFLTARYEPPKNRGKGRVVRGEDGRVVRIVEERDIPAERDPLTRQALLNLPEGNCPLYVIRALTLLRYLQNLRNENAQGQYYLTDIVQLIARTGGEVRTITTTPADPEYDLLCSDVTQAADLAIHWLDAIPAIGPQ
jgi:bifunctional UDP-N-acetylglucosamine pyrophosphorylase/glucosamine-1-phosphate N-acetyltransferase